MAKQIILVPTDFTPCAQHALRYAVAIAKTTRQKIVMVHSLYDRFGGTGFPTGETRAEHEQKMRAELEASAGDISRNDEVFCDYHIGTEMLPELLLHLSRTQDVSMVIIGEKNTSVLDDLIKGNWAADVVRDLHRPVIVVPEKASLSHINRMVFATDFHHSDLQAVKQIVLLAQAFDAHLEILHIASGEKISDKEEHHVQAFMELVERHIRFTDITYRILPGKNIEKALQNYLAEHNVSLMGLNARHRNWFERIFDRSISQDLVKHARTPLMVFHYEQPSTVLL